MKIYTEVSCNTISQLPKSLRIMRKLGWEVVEASRSDFVLRFGTDSPEATSLPRSMTFEELENFAKGETKKDQS